jgi:hypothetical protein
MDLGYLEGGSLTQRRYHRNDVDGPRTKVDAVKIPVNVFRTTFEKVWHLPYTLANHPVVED